MLIYGHRGFPDQAPENTLAAFQQAYEAGAEGIELDLRLSGDNQLVVCHDDNLRRTHGVDRRISDCTEEELGSLRALNGNAQLATASVAVPTLAQVLALLPSHTHLNIEIKADEKPRIDRLLAELGKALANRQHVFISSFDHYVIATAQQTLSHLPRALAFDTTIDFDLCDCFGCEYLSLHHDLVNHAVCEQAAKHGLQLTVWTVNQPALASRLSRMNIHSIISDNPAQMLALRQPSLVDAGNWPTR